jgi:hypothetical protein
VPIVGGVTGVFLLAAGSELLVSADARPNPDGRVGVELLSEAARETRLLSMFSLLSVLFDVLAHFLARITAKGATSPSA